MTDYEQAIRDELETHGVTFCEDCDHVEEASRKGPTYRWLCLKHANKRGVGFTTRNQWDRDAPYLYCHRVNGGNCQLFELKRTKE